ncbi:serine hydrolase [Stenotrophomonas sp. HITSZ_GD]|uniref:serine hydrolase n=1 Tax=Stenotrophomonas sp. HITSZ_GD TaxID=3037248 RepID=UPI00240E0F9B|nr:serine hydrolase [Stenotrophomonas sp. HITSZ_GD]MDG2524319.1 serine hydrolase [Stenotrophomonas sp. HITSZ_GD]
MNLTRLGIAASIVLGLAGPARAVDDAQLRGLVEQRLAGDRTGACMAVAVIERDHVARSFACADPAQAARIDDRAAFEIGSVSKTMTAALLAELIAQGKASLDDPLADYLPKGTKVPTFQGQPILLRHVVTHTSGLPGLPSRMKTANPADPYAQLTERDLLDSLGDVTLTAAPGSHFAYSNFASMLLSLAVARRAGSDFETLLTTQLLRPLGMDGAYVSHVPTGIRVAPGHTPNGRATAAWTFPVDFAGVGGVHATLEDMVRYVQAELGRGSAPIVAAMAATQQPLSQSPPMGMNWMLMPVGERRVLVHEGGTGGFSSFVAVDRTRERGVVILSDTAWHSIGSLGSLGLHLVDASFPLGKPRKTIAPDAALLDGLVGRYRIGDTLTMQLSQHDGALVIEPDGQGAHTMGYDDAGDFYPLDFDAVLRPQRTPQGYGFTWTQMGAELPAVRLEAAAQKAVPRPSAEALRAYVGEYPLVPGFSLTVSEKAGHLYVQGTGQPPIEVEAVDTDAFVAASVAAEIRFERDAHGVVRALTLLQGGQRLRGERR